MTIKTDMFYIKYKFLFFVGPFLTPREAQMHADLIRQLVHERYWEMAGLEEIRPGDGITAGEAEHCCFRTPREDVIFIQWVTGQRPASGK